VELFCGFWGKAKANLNNIDFTLIESEEMFGLDIWTKKLKKVSCPNFIKVLMS